MTDQPQLIQLAKPFPDQLIQEPPAGKYGEYVKHSTITERLLSIVGPYDQRVTETFTNDKGHIEACILEMTFTIDGRNVTIQEVGDVEGTNWKTQGARLKDAVSDAVKRCAMRVGCGLHLWSQDDYFLLTQLEKDSGVTTTPGDEKGD